MGLLVGTALPVALGLGAGWAGAGALTPSAPTAAEPAARAEEVALDALPGPHAVVPLAPIVTNLAGPGDRWLRLEMALVFAEPPERGVAEAVHADALALLRATTPGEVATPSGFLFVRADLAARARDLSGGAVSDVLIRTFLVE